jgi:DNA mismatch repair protein MutS
MADKYHRIKNYHVSTREVGNKVIFLRKLVEGGCEHSFGIHVAAMAGMPRDIISRAMEILEDLEQKSIDSAQTSKTKAPTRQIAPPIMQMSLFEASDPKADQLKADLSSLDLNVMTPIECMLKLHELKKALDE